ncbi:hypothetical protein SeMB42_g01335 [Synchytrium endobioticum]|uniref:Uncharacterized protein n=1 Tax=Synchytrium endobioticum TaxID=286115 RepID=A0A507DNY6_9FUNG|nr:hypothetical protein SeLEV6574_g01616 [Synchytrium endobioticum]TPX52567.1 hypothetical protein SeMB42_g01337 [Synchytrium endobioticum]TPX52578.1 hypothetical protein SeMB42_g01335 [Synchytrium endobioticum]
MDCMCSTRSSELRGKKNNIDGVIKQEKNSNKPQATVLLLGAGAAGKSTVMTQMQLLHTRKGKPTLTDTERRQFQKLIEESIVHNMRRICGAMTRLAIPYGSPEGLEQTKLLVDVTQQGLASKLPTLYRWSIVPHTPFGNGYVTMSEECPFDLHFDTPRCQSRCDKDVDKCGREESLKRRLLDEVFLLPREMLAKSRYVLDNSQRRYFRTSSFKTNSLVLSLLWIDTTNKPLPINHKVKDAINLPNNFHNKTLRWTYEKA